MMKSKCNRNHVMSSTFLSWTVPDEDIERVEINLRRNAINRRKLVVTRQEWKWKKHSKPKEPHWQCYKKGRRT